MGEVEAEVVKQLKLEIESGLVKETLVLVAMLLLQVCMHAS